MHWGRVTHICVGNLTNIDSDNGLSPGRRQAIIWTNAGLLLIGPLGTNFNEILIEILTFSFKEMRLKVSSAKWWPFCLGLSELMQLSCGAMNKKCSPEISENFQGIHHYTVETLYNTVNFCWSTHKRHSIARPKGRGMGCLLWVQRATYCVDLSKLSSIKYLL